MMKRMGILAFCVISSFSAPAMAGDIDGKAVLGGAVGGAAGAAIGSAIGGKEGAMIGAGLGGVTGVAVATSDKKEPEVVHVKEKVVYVHEDEHHDNGLHRGHRKRKGHGHD
ncbi:hypothetical protein ACUUL3_13400 [Thiovibrio sp. JS02]